jgi:hypothetical protein
MLIVVTIAKAFQLCGCLVVGTLVDSLPLQKTFFDLVLFCLRRYKVRGVFMVFEQFVVGRHAAPSAIQLMMQTEHQGYGAGIISHRPANGMHNIL